MRKVKLNAVLLALLVCLMAVPFASAGIYQQNNTFVWKDSHFSDNVVGRGVVIGVNENITLINATMAAASTPTNCTINTLSGGTLLKQGTVSGITVTFNYNLTKGQNYRMECHSNGASYFSAYNNSAAGFPKNNQFLNFLTGSYTGANNSNNLMYEYMTINALNETSPPPSASADNITLASRSNTDATDQTLFNTPYYINWTYQVNASAGSLSTAYANYTLTSTVLSCVQAINGTCNRVNGSYATQLYYANTSSGGLINSTINFTENLIYPYTENLPFPTIISANYNLTITQNNDYIADAILNISNATQYNFYEVPVLTTGLLRVYYYNDSYDFSSNPALNANVHEIRH